MNEIRNGNGSWQKPAIAGLWGVSVIFAGWLWSATTDASKATAERLAVAEAQVRQGQERLATLEEADRNTREALKRIEDGVNELRRDRRR